jgi:hypothetical protein
MGELAEKKHTDSRIRLYRIETSANLKLGTNVQRAKLIVDGIDEDTHQPLLLFNAGKTH